MRRRLVVMLAVVVVLLAGCAQCPWHRSADSAGSATSDPSAFSLSSNPDLDGRTNARESALHSVTGFGK
jgi:hypothetical protein